MSVGSSAYVSMQRFDADWEEHVDVEITDIKERDKVTVKIIESDRTTAITSCQENNSLADENAVNRILQNLKDEWEALDYRLNVALATLSSMKEKPRPRETFGRNISFTCSNCHYRGHRVTVCQQDPCQGYFECGFQALHEEYRGELKEVSHLFTVHITMEAVIK